jgi:hypothetical protein
MKLNVKAFMFAIAILWALSGFYNLMAEKFKGE